MAGVTAAASISDALRDQRVAGIVESLFRNNEVMGEFPMIPFTGGATINITHHYAGNASVGTYSEGDAIGTAGSHSYISAQWPEQHYKGVMQITGHARDYLRNGSEQAAFYNQIGEESTRLFQDLIHKVSTDMLSTGTTAPVGIQGIVDSTGTVAGLSRVTYSWFAAYENSGSSTVINTLDLNSAMYNSQDATYAGQVNEIWTSWKQKAKYNEAVGNTGASVSQFRQVVSGGQPLNPTAANVQDNSWFGNIMIKAKRNLTDTIWLGLTKEDFFVGVMRDWTVKEIPSGDDSDKFLVTGAFGLGCRNPKRSWKMTGYTT